ncbi:MAG: thermonuclease family protein [Arenibacterium sp.]
MLRICALFVLTVWATGSVADPSGVIRVIDGDTWDVGQTRVRLFGIDAMERDQECQRPDKSAWACGVWTTEMTRARYGGRHATCRAIALDRYGRTVARCYIEGQDVGRAMVQDGLALAYRKYSMDYDLDEKRARVAGIGIHQGQVEAPAEYRARRVAEPEPSGCVIKGNISSEGERIYHLPGQENYSRTRISLAKGERWFCSEREAQLAGWRRARR